MKFIGNFTIYHITDGFLIFFILVDLWWEDYGATTPNLQQLAILILLQPCSASGCERNWSTFQNIHTKKRNRLTQKRLNDLVYVKYNLLLHEKKVKGQASYEALDLDDIDPYSTDWIAPADGEDVDVGEPFLTNDQLAEFEKEADEWDADVAAREEEHELGHPSKASIEREVPIRAPVEDVATATTSTPPTQQQRSLLSSIHRHNLRLLLSTFIFSLIPKLELNMYSEVVVS